MTAPESFDPQPGDLVVVPEGTKIPTGFPAMVYQMKFLLSPSIIRTGNAMNLFQFKKSHIGKWFSKNEQKEPVVVAEKGLITVLSDDFSDMVFEELSAKDVNAALQNHLEPRNTVNLAPINSEVELATFFRYARGTVFHQYCEGSVEEIIDPKGGVTFYVELDPENKCFAFAYSLCHSDENFCTKIGRHIAKQRFDNEDWYEVGNYDSDYSVVNNIKIAIHNSLYAGSYGKLDDDKTNVVFTSLSERFNEGDLKTIYQRI